MTDWIPCDKPWIDADSDDPRFDQYDGSFVGDGLNKPGTLIEVRETADLSDPNSMTGTRQFLVGHINPNAGKCGCCGEIRQGAIVTRYRVIWSEGEGE